ncbi:MAG: alkaline phosphatase PhoX [Gammaproteobacteria bacterium]
MKSNLLTACGLLLAVSISTPAFAEDLNIGKKGFGEYRDHLLRAHSKQLFGVSGPLRASSTDSVDAATADADPTSLVTVARSLRVKVVSAKADLAPNIDMMALWPRQNPTHIIACNEQDATQPGLQRISLADGAVETILTGTVSCDPVQTTAWGTLVIGEESGNSGTVLELIDPLHTTGVHYDHDTHALSGSDAGNVAVRPAIGHLSFEGVVVYPNGVMYYGDENRPAEGTAGGAYFKFVPKKPWAGGDITSLDESPLVNGKVYGLRLGLRSDATDYGQGSNTGLGTWVAVKNSFDADLRSAAADLQLTGYYRPEDANMDRKSLAKGKVRFCANNTGNEENDKNWGETICVTDGTLEEAAANSAVPEVQLFVTGNREFAMMDNIAYQPGRGNWIIQEDGDAPGFDVNPHNNDIWMCLEDGGDVDTLSDGCIRIVTMNDLTAESTGGFFDASGKNYYFSVQHNVTGHGVILKISGWK